MFCVVVQRFIKVEYWWYDMEEIIISNKQLVELLRNGEMEDTVKVKKKNGTYPYKLYSIRVVEI